MFPALRTPHGILSGFGTALLAVAVFTAFDAGRRPALETIVFPTGAGDRRFCQLPPNLGLTSEIVRHEGRAYGPARLEPIREADARMLAAGRDDTGTVILYRPVDPGDAPRLHLKTGDERYLPLTPIDGKLPAAP